MKLVPYDGVLIKKYVGEILKSLDKFQVVASSIKFSQPIWMDPFHQQFRGRARDGPIATPLAPARSS